MEYGILIEKDNWKHQFLTPDYGKSTFTGDELEKFMGNDFYIIKRKDKFKFPVENYKDLPIVDIIISECKKKTLIICSI